MIYDINPQVSECQQGDATNLSINSGSIKCMILDPPFLFEIRNRKNSNYGANTHGILKGFEGLKELSRTFGSLAHCQSNFASSLFANRK